MDEEERARREEEERVREKLRAQRTREKTAETGGSGVANPDDDEEVEFSPEELARFIKFQEQQAARQRAATEGG